MKYIAVVFVFFARNIAYCQGYESIEHLVFKTDEILVVKIIDESMTSESYMTCKSYVTAEVGEILKVKELKSDILRIRFVRILRCAEGGLSPSARILDKDKRYIIFLASSRPGYDLISNQKEYSLSDYILGIQEYNDDLYDYIQIKRREKRQ